MKNKNLGLLGILLVMTILMSSAGLAAVSWVIPTSGQHINDGQVLNVTTTTSTTSNVTFYHRSISASAWTIIGSFANTTANTTAASFNFTWTTLPTDGNYTINATAYSDKVGATGEAGATEQIIASTDTTTFSSPVPTSGTIRKDNNTAAGFQVTTSEFCRSATMYFNGNSYSMSNTTSSSTIWQYTTAITDVPYSNYEWYVTSVCSNDTATSSKYELVVQAKGKPFVCNDGTLVLDTKDCPGGAVNAIAAKGGLLKGNSLAIIVVLIIGAMLYLNKK